MVFNGIFYIVIRAVCCLVVLIVWRVGIYYKDTILQICKKMVHVNWILCLLLWVLNDWCI